MLSTEDIKKLTEYQKQVFVTKEEFGKWMEIIQESFFGLQTSIDAIAQDN